MRTLRPERDHAIEDVKIGFVGGGSRSWARTLMNDLARCEDLSGAVALYDHDYESAKQNEELGNWIQTREEAVGDWEYVAVETVGDALADADFVILSTQDPPAETFAHDLDVPKEYGIYQTVGDTVGPGGTLRAMRAIPQYREIAAGVREHCPDAWVLNYTNPMTVCTRTLYEEFPDVNAIGLCHEVYHVQDYLAGLVESHLGEERPPSEEIDVTVTGINHFTWLTGATWRGRDLFPALERELEAERPLPGGFEPGDLDDASYFVDNNQVALDLFDRFGAFPAAGDRHLAEFVPWYLSIDDPAEIHRWGIRLTPSEHRVDHWPEGERSREAYLSGEASFEFRESGEEMVDLLRALCGLEPIQSNVNLPNRGQAPDLPEGAVVETNALVTADDVTPLTADPLPRQVRSMVDAHVTNQETLVDAGFRGDLDLAYRAFLDDRLVTIDPTRARDLFAELVEIQREYLESWDLDDSRVL